MQLLSPDYSHRWPQVRVAIHLQFPKRCQILTKTCRTTVSTTTSTYWAITRDTCLSNPPLVLKRADIPYTSSNISSNISYPSSVSSSAVSLGTFVPLVINSPSSSKPSSLSYTLPPYATPCGVPYYYSSACSCISAHQTYIYETTPVSGVGTISWTLN